MKTRVDINERWEKGIPHHPKSFELYELIDAVDLKLGGDAFGFKAGGDGDNGEHLMYILDIIHEAQDNNELEELKDLVRG